jgi:phosphoglycerate dehydrogenase-like enzyme
MSANPRPLSECVVLVTPRSFGMHDASLRSELEREIGEVRYQPGPLSVDVLAAAVTDVDGLLAGLDEIDATVFANAPRLRVVARYGVGVDRVDLRAAAAHGVAVTITPGANANAVAELTVALMFALARPLVNGRDRVRAGEWPALQGIEVAGRTIGLLGLGRIGRMVAKKAAGLGLRTIAYDPYLSAAEVGALVDLRALASESDFLSVHAPLTTETRGIVNRTLLEQLKPGSVLINTARGELVDEDALIWALDHGPLRAAALDVLAHEPPPTDGRLLQRDDVLITPHVGPHTAEATTAMGRMALDELLAVLSGQPPRYPA